MEKNKLNKILFVVVAISVVFGAALFLGGCGSDSSSGGSATTTPAFSGNVFLDSILPDMNYYHSHNSTSTDRKKMLVTINKADAPYGKTLGVTELYLLDADKMSQGQVAKLREPVSIGSNASTPKNVVFRSTWTQDDTKIMVSGKDRFWVIDAATLTPLNGTDGVGGLDEGYFENHDALPTTDSKYAILTLRTKPHADADANKLDGELKLYDLTANAVVGAGVSVCNNCHISQLGGPRNATLCGLDGKIEKQTDGTYSGTVYVPGHGGHIAKVALTIDPSDTENPITVNTLDKIVVSSKKFSGTGTSQYKMHDVRIDGNTMYWSTFNTDENNKVHYGKVDLTTETVTDQEGLDIPDRATMPAPIPTGDRGSIYCGSGQSDSAFMPITMTNEVYVTVIPKF
jgi:hypothetical protein